MGSGHITLVDLLLRGDDSHPAASREADFQHRSQGARPEVSLDWSSDPDHLVETAPASQDDQWTGMDMLQRAAKRLFAVAHFQFLSTTFTLVLPRWWS